jgi:hypothetical protein
MPNDRELDQIIDSALSSYSARETRPGLEEHILVSAFAEAPHKTRFAQAFTLAIPAAACLAGILFFAGRHSSRPNSLETASRAVPSATSAIPQRIAEAIPTQPTREAFTPRHKATQRRSVPARETLPKEKVFPSPSPLTAEELAVVARLRMPAQMSQQTNMATASNAVEISPIHIAELQITPIAPPDNQFDSLSVDSLPKVQEQ